ncbi:hypothetical protein [Methylobacterium radiotolerans]|uniref:hypothetical protein n=1 Tax=Methylobacterium radiotolerans TaxID=31998 RepID=UPI0011BD55B8|nr:hypothetical protein [Methylobacterium radiotolerans]
MTEERTTSGSILRRIAAALGDDVAIFRDRPARVRAAEEALALLTAFERVVDRDDRRSCIDFVSSVAAQQDRHRGNC